MAFSWPIRRVQVVQILWAFCKPEKTSLSLEHLTQLFCVTYALLIRMNYPKINFPCVFLLSSPA